MNIYSANSYRQILEIKLQENESRRGYKSLMAEAAGCHRSYLPQVLSRTADLTLDQGARLTKFWKMTEDEAEFFIELLHLEKATSEELKQIIQRRLDKISTKYIKEAKHFKTIKTLSTPNQHIFFTHWYYGALHMLLATNHSQKPAALAERLGIHEDLIHESLELLQSMGLIHRAKQSWVLSHDYFFTENRTMRTMLQSNWRQQAIAHIQKHSEKSFNATFIYSISKKDIATIRTLVEDCIAKTKKIVAASESEEVIAMNFDLFVI